MDTEERNLALSVFIHFLGASARYYLSGFPDVLSVLVSISTCCHSDIMVLIPRMTAVEN